MNILKEQLEKAKQKLILNRRLLAQEAEAIGKDYKEACTRAESAVSEQNRVMALFSAKKAQIEATNAQLELIENFEQSL